MPTEEEILTMIEQIKKEGYHATGELVLLCIKLEELKTFKEIKGLLQDLIEVSGATHE